MKTFILIAVSYLLVVFAEAETRIAAWGNQAPIPDEATKTAISISAGKLHSVAVLFDGTTVGWGDPSITDNRFAPFTAAELATYNNPGYGYAMSVFKAYAGGAHTAYWLNNSMVVVRGENSNGRLGNFPFPGDAPFPVILDVTVGNNFTAVAYRNGGTHYIRVWGTVLSTQINKLIGPGDINLNHNTWNSAFPVSKLAGGLSHLAWIMNNGTAGVVTGFGGSLTSIPSTGDPNNSGAVDLTCGNGFTLWRKSSGSVYAVGYTHTDPVATLVSKMSAGVGHVLFLKTNGTVTSITPILPTGNQNGQATVPVLPPSPLVTEVSAGHFHSMAMTTRRNHPFVAIAAGGTPDTFDLSWPSGYPEYKVLQKVDDLLNIWTDDQTIGTGVTTINVTPPVGSLTHFWKLRAPAFFYLE